jgi:hypothetical protein
LADKGCELDIEVLDKDNEWENYPSGNIAGTTGYTHPGSYSYGSTRVIYLSLLY